MSIFGSPTHASHFNNTSATTVAATLSITTGHLIVVHIYGSGGSGTTCTGVSDGFNTYTVLGSPSSAGQSNTNVNGSCFVAYCLSSVHTGSVTITATFGAAQTSFQGITAWDVPISGGTAAFDINTFSMNSSTTTTPTSSAFNTAGSDEEFYLSANNDLTGLTYTAETTPLACTLDESGSGASGFLGSEHLTTPFTSTQTAITPKITSSSASTMLMAVTAFKAAAAAGPKNLLMLMGCGT